jgi:hypothetical protein
VTDDREGDEHDGGDPECEDEGAEHDGSEPDEDGEPTLGWTIDGNCGAQVWGCAKGEAGEPTGPEIDRRRAAYRARRDQQREVEITASNGSDCVLVAVPFGRHGRCNVRPL